MSAAELTAEELTRVICAARNHGDVSQWYELVPRCYTQCGWVGLLETAPNGGPRKEQFAAHWQEQVANELRPIIANHVRRALEDAAKDIDLSEFYDPDPRGRVSQECGHAETAAHRWLTARAATAPDPRETKD